MNDQETRCNTAQSCFPRYDKEFADYQQTESYKQYLEVEQAKDNRGASSCQVKKNFLSMAAFACLCKIAVNKAFRS